MNRDKHIFFKKLSPQDAKEMFFLEHEVFTLPWSEEQCQRALEQQSFSAWGIWNSQKLIAYISFYHNLDELEIINFGVIPSARRKRFGLHLLQALLQGAAKMGIQKIVLEVRETNLPAITLYEKVGFIAKGIRKAYYPDTRENAIIYIKSLSM